MAKRPGSDDYGPGWAVFFPVVCTLAMIAWCLAKG